MTLCGISDRVDGSKTMAEATYAGFAEEDNCGTMIQPEHCCHLQNPSQKTSDRLPKPIPIDVATCLGGTSLSGEETASSCCPPAKHCVTRPTAGCRNITADPPRLGATSEATRAAAAFLAFVTLCFDRRRCCWLCCHICGCLNSLNSTAPNICLTYVEEGGVIEPQAYYSISGLKLVPELQTTVRQFRCSQLKLNEAQVHFGAHGRLH